MFSADLFNEGLDLPQVDTILLLRPTQSATIFLQQIGRGLRRSYGKPVLTVLDLIGQHRREFRFDVRYRALTGSSHRVLEQQIEQGFPYLPSGSQLILDRVSQRIVLDNVRRQLQLSRRDLVVDVRSHGDLPLARYLEDAGRDLADVYKSKSSWTTLRREAGWPTPHAEAGEAALLRRMVALSHVDDPERATAYTKFATADSPRYDDLTEREQRLARMLFFTLWPDRGGFSSYGEGLDHLRAHPAVCAELRELVSLGLDRARYLPQPLGEGLQGTPMASHAHYRREEILAGLDWASLERSARGNITGVAWSEAMQTDALMITCARVRRRSRRPRCIATMRSARTCSTGSRRTPRRHSRRPATGTSITWSAARGSCCSSGKRLRTSSERLRSFALVKPPMSNTAARGRSRSRGSCDGPCLVRRSGKPESRVESGLQG